MTNGTGYAQCIMGGSTHTPNTLTTMNESLLLTSLAISTIEKYLRICKMDLYRQFSGQTPDEKAAVMGIEEYLYHRTKHVKEQQC
jgi:hypothetical protein